LRDGGLGADHGGVQRQPGGERQPGARERQRDHAVGIAHRELRRLGFAGDLQQRRTVRGLRREFGNDAHHAPPRRLQPLHQRAQPDAVAGRHPDRRAGLGRGFERKVQGLGIVEQMLFEQAVEHGAQLRRTAHAALGQRDAVPRQRRGRNAERDFRAGRQQREQRAAMVAQGDAVVASLGPVVLARGVGRGEGGDEQQRGHFVFRRAGDCRGAPMVPLLLYL
jgi:hypothetical protein